MGETIGRNGGCTQRKAGPGFRDRVYRWKQEELERNHRRGKASGHRLLLQLLTFVWTSCQGDGQAGWRGEVQGQRQLRFGESTGRWCRQGVCISQDVDWSLPTWCGTGPKRIRRTIHPTQGLDRQGRCCLQELRGSPVEQHRCSIVDHEHDTLKNMCLQLKQRNGKGSCK